MLYTRKGDNGTTKTFCCDQRLSKSSAIAEALGSLDEINSFLGLLKIKSRTIFFELPDQKISAKETIDRVQQDLFIIQAELAGGGKKISSGKIIWLEGIIDGIEKTLPPIKTFFVSGGTECATLADISRTIARRAERRVVAVCEEGKTAITPETLSYLNRLSSLLYAFARAFNHSAGVAEDSPRYD